MLRVESMLFRPTHRIRLIGACLALAAVLVFFAAAAHGHNDHCHDFCWLCHSSFGAIGLPAALVAFLIVWRSSLLHVDLTPDFVSRDVVLHTSPRAPPAI